MTSLVTRLAAAHAYASARRHPEQPNVFARTIWIISEIHDAIGLGQKHVADLIGARSANDIARMRDANEQTGVKLRQALELQQSLARVLDHELAQARLAQATGRAP